jgi:hypothetical protein
MLYDDGLVKPNPPVFRAMDLMKKALEAAGHEGALYTCDIFPD